jgi:4-amino-4-deoxy-L-arabinose transferase-like glycosyltransferase
MAVEHFDEGVYASNLWFAAEEAYQYPNRHLYAPPLLPFFIEWSVVLFGPKGMAPMLPNLVAGWGTILLAGWVAYRWFGPVAAMVCMVLAAFSDVHILFCRTALTDALLCFLLIASVYLAASAYEHRHFGFAIAAGVVAGLAWWTKYNGWLAIGVAGGGVVCEVLHRRPWRELYLSLTIWCIIALVAALVWLPVPLSLEQGFGGYSAVAQNHAKYIVGFDGWFRSLVTQTLLLRELEGPSTIAGMIIGLVGPLLVMAPSQFGMSVDDEVSINRTNIRRLGISTSVVTAVVGAGLLWGFVLVLAVLGMVGIFVGVRSQWTIWRAGKPSHRIDYLLVMLMVWFLGLCAATPFYHPYPRLTLPWHLAAWLLAGFAIAHTTSFGAFRPEYRSWTVRRAWLAGFSVVIGVAVVIGGIATSPWGQSAWQPRTGLKRIAHAMLDDIFEGNWKSGSRTTPYVVYVYGEPALLYHLHAAKLEAAQQAIPLPVAHLNWLEEPAPNEVKVYLVTAMHAEATPGFTEELRKNAHRLQLVKSYSYEISDLVLSDNFPPREWKKQRLQKAFLYRVK